MIKRSSSKIQKSSARVVVRPLASSDRAAIITLARASRDLHRNVVNPPKTPAQFAKYMKRSRDKSNVRLVICRIEDNVVMGTISFSQIFYGQLKSAYMGYWIGVPFANHGYMTEAMQLALGFAFRKLMLHRVEANIQPGNIASIKLVKRLGFSKEGFSAKYVKVAGRWRDHERWALLKENCKF